MPEKGRVTGAAAVVTLAGLGTDRARTSEFVERFVRLGQDVATAPGHRASLVPAPVEGAVMTCSAWSSLHAAVTWAQHSPTHAATVAWQEDHQLLETGGSLRCAVLHSSGSPGDLGDPLAGRTGTVTAAR